MKKLIFLLLGLILSLSFVSAAIIKTVPEQSVWFADGITEYKVFVYVDNNGITSGENRTRLVDWEIMNPFGFEYVGWELPPSENDFFGGFSTTNGWIRGPGIQSARWISPIQGVENKEGYVVIYKFKVPVGFALSNDYYFDFIPWHTVLTGLDYLEQSPVELGYETFSVVEKLNLSLSNSPGRLNYYGCPDDGKSKFRYACR